MASIYAGSANCTNSSGALSSLSFNCNYTWGSWSNDTIKLTINSLVTNGTVIYGNNATIFPLVFYSVSGASIGTVGSSVYIGYGNFTNKTISASSGSITLSKSHLDSNNQITIRFNVSFTSVVRTVSFKLTAPALTAGSPTGRTSVTNITQTTADRSAIVNTWGTNATAGTWTWTYGIGQYNLNSGGSTNTTLKNLTPNTTYNYKFYIKNGQGKTATYTGTFKTLGYTAPTSAISLNSVTPNSITCNYSTSGSNISQFYVYLNNNLYTTVSTTNPSGTFVISGLSPKTTYNISIQAYTPTGNLWGAVSNVVSATTYPNPVAVNANSTSIIDLQPFNCKVQAVSTSPVDTNAYGFTLLDSNLSILRNEVVQSSAIYNFTNLTPETTYYAAIRVQTKVSGVWSSDILIMPFTTPADQASIYLKADNIWRRGKVWIKVQDSWIKAKSIYIKANDAWRKNSNF